MAKNKKKKKISRILVFARLQILLMLVVAAGVGWYFYGGYAQKVSALQREAKELVKDSDESTFRSVQTSLVYDADNTLISTLNGEKDVYYLEYEDIPAYVPAAMVSIEDKKFYSHNGIDIKAILRAAKAMIQNGEVTQGAAPLPSSLQGIFF